MSSADYDHRVLTLMSRVVDGEATTEQWSEFEGMAERDPTLWRELAEHQRDQSDLSTGVLREISIADRVNAPVHEHITERFGQRLRIVGAWGGWAAAAAVALVWAAGQMPRPGERPTDGFQNGSQAGLITTPSDYLARYLAEGKERGQVVSELPDKVMIDVRPTESGGYDIYYLRQIIERTQVRDLYTTGQDEQANPVPVPVHLVPSSPLGPM